MNQYADLKSRLMKHAQSGWQIAIDAAVAIDDLERKLKSIQPDGVVIPESLYRAVIARLIKQRNSSTDLGLIRQLEKLDPDFHE